MDALLTIKQVVELGVSQATVWRKTRNGEWPFVIGKRNGRFGEPPKLIKLSGLPLELQLEWARRNQSAQAAAAPDEKPVENDPRSDVESDPHQQHNTSGGWCSPASPLDRLNQALLRFPANERDNWLAELQRLAGIIRRFEAINPKRLKNLHTGISEFVPAVIALCGEAACTEPLIIARESGRAKTPSPHTLERWSKAYRKEGVLAFVRALPAYPSEDAGKRDGRRAEISDAAIEWINTHWQNYGYPRALFKALKKKAKKEKWSIPSEKWVYRQYAKQPVIVIAKKLKGKKEYSKYTPYVPRDYSDLEALQILCGDHSQRDVTVMLRDGTLARPWLTTWQDMRTGLIWGWHLDLVPSSYTVGAAYANGVMTFGAQPPSRSDEGFYSYVYTDQGRDYKSKNWDGKVIGVHEAAMDFHGGIEVLRVQRQVGIVGELDIKHLLARGYNAREKPVERFHRIISDWEQNTFEEYCGRDAKNKPDAWRDLYARHQKLLKIRRVKESTIIRFEEYREALAGFIHEYNASEHERVTLGGARIVPLDEFHRLYTTKYTIAAEALALLLMKADKRKIGPLGVQFFQKGWNYAHPAMVEFIGLDVEIRFDSADSDRVWAVLPNKKICEAMRINRTSVLEANPQTYAQVGRLKAEHSRVIRDHRFINFDGVQEQRPEVSQPAEELEREEQPIAVGENPARVHFMTRMDRPKLRAVDAEPAKATVEEVQAVEPDYSIFVPTAPQPDSDFDLEMMGEE
jgi:hypothetical protein